MSIHVSRRRLETHAGLHTNLLSAVFLSVTGLFVYKPPARPYPVLKQRAFLQERDDQDTEIALLQTR